MKKIIIVLFILISLFGCKKEDDVKENDYSKLSIISPTGAPSLAFISDINNENFETNSTPSNIVAMMSDKSDKQVVVIDTISGIKAINNGAPYKLAANITFGNFFVASTGNDKNGVMEKGDRLVLFGEGLTPDVIFHYLYGNEYDENIEYVSAASDAGKVLAAGVNFETGNSIDYVLVAEPILTNVMYNQSVPTYGSVTIYKNIQKDYKDKTGHDMIQASLFIKNDSDASGSNDYLDYLETNINNSLSDMQYLNDLINNKSDEEISSKYGINKTLLKEVMISNTIGLGFKNAYDNKESIDEFISIFNVNKTNEEIYFK